MAISIFKYAIKCLWISGPYHCDITRLHYSWNISDVTKSADICIDVNNIAEQKPINYIMENLCQKSVCRHPNSVIRSSFLTYFTDTSGSDFWIGTNDIDIEEGWAWESDKSKLLWNKMARLSIQMEWQKLWKWQHSLYLWKIGV